MNIRALTLMLLDSLEYAERDSGESFIRIKDSAPGWIQDVIRECHTGMLPDDYRYKFVADAAEALNESEGDLDTAREIVDSQVDIYTSSLTKWLDSDNQRVYYLTQAAKDFGIQDGFKQLQIAQYLERAEVLDLLYNALDERSQ